MQADLTDNVKWAVAQRIADPKRVAIDGISYGGCAALAAAAFTPDIDGGFNHDREGNRRMSIILGSRISSRVVMSRRGQLCLQAGALSPR
jgi:hypothetical protein